jgi:hypothetical protein
MVGGAIAGREIERKMEDERGCVALGLMADAGFDPWQAPEAWRLLAPGHLPKDPSKLRMSRNLEVSTSIVDFRPRHHPDLFNREFREDIGQTGTYPRLRGCFLLVTQD